MNIYSESFYFYRFFRLIKIGLAVITTFVLCWLPFLSSVESALQVLHRLFPFARGLYEVGCISNTNILMYQFTIMVTYKSFQKLHEKHCYSLFPKL